MPGRKLRKTIELDEATRQANQSADMATELLEEAVDAAEEAKESKEVAFATGAAAAPAGDGTKRLEGVVEHAMDQTVVTTAVATARLAVAEAAEKEAKARSDLAKAVKCATDARNAANADPGGIEGKAADAWEVLVVVIQERAFLAENERKEAEVLALAVEEGVRKKARENGKEPHDG